MKSTALATIAALAACTSSAFSQTGGPLTPPAGPPQQAMKSLDQMEPRTPLIDGAPGVTIAPSGTITISQSGSYYLTGNVAVTSGHGIHIDPSGVTLDLRGFTVTSSSESAQNSGIVISGDQVAIHNGHIRSGTTYNSSATEDQYTGTGFESGITVMFASEIRIRNVSVSGCDLFGINCGLNNSSIECCTVGTVGDAGIYGNIVRDCVAKSCGGTAIVGKTVLNCLGDSNGGSGINASTVSNSYGYTWSKGEMSYGIFAENVSNSHGYSNGGDGIQATTVINSTGFSMVGSGIRAKTVSNSYGETSSPGQGASGIDADHTVQNSYASSAGGDGIQASIVSYSIGYTNGSHTTSEGIYAGLNASYSFGHSDNAGGGDGIRTTIAVFSTGTGDGTDPGTAGIQAVQGTGCYTIGGEAITHKYLMP